jgi:hypothetical protein
MILSGEGFGVLTMRNIFDVLAILSAILAVSVCAVGWMHSRVLGHEAPAELELRRVPVSAEGQVGSC